MTALECSLPDMPSKIMPADRIVVDIVPSKQQAQILKILGANKGWQAFKCVFHGYTPFNFTEHFVDLTEHLFGSGDGGHAAALAALGALVMSEDQWRWVVIMLRPSQKGVA